MITYIFQREYSEREKTEYDHLLRSSINRLPFTLSSPIEKFLRHIEKKDYGRAMNLAIDFFEISVQYLSCILIALIQKKEEELSFSGKHKDMIRAIQKIDEKRPLSFGDWVNDIFSPLLKAANDRIPDERLLVCLNKYFVNKGGNLLTGSKNEPSIVKIRNEYRGHSSTLSEEIYKGVVYTLEPRIFSMLKAVAPLQEWFYFSCKEKIAQNKFRMNILNGYTRNREDILETKQSLEVYHYYICQGQPETENPTFTDIFPLIFCNTKNHVYVIQTLKDECISYISSNEDAITFTDDCWNEALDRRLQKTLPSFDIAKELNREQIKEYVDHASRKFLELAYKEKKYNQEFFIDRSILSGIFRDFQESDKTLFPLLGEAGQGKTNQLCYWTEQLIEQNSMALIFNSSGFTESTLEEKLNDMFGFSRRKPVKKLLDNIHKKTEENHEKVYFFFDAINECLSYKGSDNNAIGPLDLYFEIRSLLINDDYPCFKVLFTCRSYTWKNLIQPQLPEKDTYTFQANDENEVVVHGFSNEEFEKAYAVYSELYRLDTAFPSLSKNCTIRLKNPLILKIACTNYLGKALPDSMSPYTSISLFEKMLHDISNSYAGNKQYRILKALTQHILFEYEKGIPADGISEDHLRRAFKDENSHLHTMAKLVYKNDVDSFSIAYGELLNKPERPVLRLAEKDNKTGRLQFIYERFLEFMLASVFVERERKGLHDKANIPAGTFVNELQKSAANVVFVGAMRNALIMDYLKTDNLSVILELIGEYGDNSEVRLLISETINVLIRENYEKEIFKLIKRLLDEQPKEGEALIQNFNAINKKIESNQLNEEVLLEHIKLSHLLAPILRLRKQASVSVINGIFLTDYFNEGLYKKKPFELLWALMTDPLIDVRNDACMYVYYLSKKTHTIDNSLIKDNLMMKIIKEMFNYINHNPVLKIALVKQCRNQSVIFAETASRLSVLLAIDTMMSENQSDRKQVFLLLNEIRKVLKHLTLNFSLLKMLKPFLMIIIRRQVTFQATYVNNIIEYQTFWDSKLIPVRSAQDDEWSRENFREILTFIFHYSRYYKHRREIVDNREIPDFSKHKNHILSAYKKGDSFSYFMLERIMVIMGTCDWEYIRPVVFAIFSDDYRKNEWFDYSQMSMLYILFQLSIHNKEANEQIIPLYSRESEDWTQRCRGLFKGINSARANPTGMYKRNVMSWYCVVYCYHTGDGVARQGDEKPVPVFYKLLDDAINNKDRELLYHLLENISELVTDYGLIKTSLELIKYIMTKFDCGEKVNEFNKIQLKIERNGAPIERGGVYKDDLSTLIGKVLSTAKNCFNKEVDIFIRKDIAGLKFPDVSKFSSEILNYIPSGESLSDLFTHKFGNFVMWSLLNEEAINKCVYEIMSMAVDCPNCFKWYDNTVRIICRDLFNFKL